MLGKKLLAEITEQDLQYLVINQVPEGKFIEYKQKLPGGTDSEKKEFLADVSSFANASGGHLIFGVKEAEGVPLEIAGVEVSDADATAQRVENLLREGLDPRLPNCGIRIIPLSSGAHVVLIEIAKSWASPHMVTLQNHGKFYSRNSVGKYPLDVRELRTEFTLAETAKNRIRDFRLNRLGQIVATETPVPLFNAPKIVLQLVPLGAGLNTQQFNLLQLEQQTTRLAPIYSNGWNHRHNFDGFLTYGLLPEMTASNSYVQIFRDGSIEAVESFLLRENRNGKVIPSLSFEEKILEALPRFLSIQRDLGVSLPIFLMLSLIGVKGYRMGVDSTWARWGNPEEIDRDVLIVPEVLVDDFDASKESVLRPVFDIVWNAAGWPASIYFDKAGKWRER